MSDEIRPFQIAATDEVLDDLRARLHNTRWPDPEVVDDWSQGTPQGYLQEVCRYWADGYDWRRCEQALNGWGSSRVEVGGLGVHVLHAGTARGPDGRLVTAGGRVLAVTAVGSDLADARARAYEGVRSITFAGAQFRTDIARDAARG